MKKCTTIVFLGLFLFLAGCETNNPKRVTEIFFSAYVKGDTQTMAACLDPLSAQTMEGMYGLAGDFIGVDGSTLANLSPAVMAAMDAQGWLSVDYSIGDAAIRGDNAVVDVTLVFYSDGNYQTQEIQVPCIKAKGKWYITMFPY